MPIKTAVDIMWLQPGAVVDWRWSCGGAPDTPPPPLYFWFIPLTPAEDGEAFSATPGPTALHADEDGERWAFDWRLSNAGRGELPLKINIWTPVGAGPCASAS